MRLTFCGVRGSTPSPGPAYLRYGGNTSCVAIAPGEGVPDLLLDAGTGMAAVTELLGGAAYDGSVLVGHLHWDHTQGMPFFGGGFGPGHRVAIHMPAQEPSAEEAFARSFSPPNFPILPAQLGPGWSFGDLEEGWHQIEGYHVLAREIPHKGGRTFGFRVEHRGDDRVAAVAYLSDHSPTTLGPGPDGEGERHDAIMALAGGADVLVHDAQHLASQFPGVQFLGHASVEYCVGAAIEAGVGTVVLYHHAPTRTDDEIDAILGHARSIAAGRVAVIAAYEGLVVDLPVTTPPHEERVDAPVRQP